MVDDELSSPRHILSFESCVVNQVAKTDRSCRSETMVFLVFRCRRLGRCSPLSRPCSQDFVYSDFDDQWPSVEIERRTTSA